MSLVNGSPKVFTWPVIAKYSSCVVLFRLPGSADVHSALDAAGDGHSVILELSVFRSHAKSRSARRIPFVRCSRLTAFAVCARLARHGESVAVEVERAELPSWSKCRL